jgi:DNA-binding transcriptional MerR regulator
VRRSKKLIIGVVLAAILLFGSLGGTVLAGDGDDNGDTPKPWTEFQEKLADKLGITLEELQEKIAEVREGLPLPQRNGEGWQGRHKLAGPFADLDEETLADLKEDLAEVREEMRSQMAEIMEEMQGKTAEILEKYGIDIDAWKEQFAENFDGKRPFFMGRRGMGGPGFGFGGLRGWLAPDAPAE